MNHVGRIYKVAGEVRGLTREMARAAVDGYLEALAEEIAAGGWVNLPGIGRVQVILRLNKGLLRARLEAGRQGTRPPGVSVQTKIRLSTAFKARCRKRLSGPK